jgi:tetratricopeptide (TPR) repeat protein
MSSIIDTVRRTCLALAAACGLWAALVLPAAAAGAPSSDERPGVYDNALGLYRTHQYKETIALLDPYIVLHPSDARALVLRGDAKAELDQDAAALVDYNRAIVAAPDYQYAYTTRCQTRLVLDDSDGALSDCNLALKLDPADPLAYEARADVYFDKEAYDKALSDYSRAIENGRSSAYVFAARCDTRRILADYGGAAEDCERAHAIAPDNRRMLWARGRLALATKRYADAVALFGSYIAQKPDDSDTSYYFRGFAYNRLGKYDLALIDLKRYVGLAPADGDGYRERAIARWGLGDRDGAKADLDAAIKAYRHDGDGDAVAEIEHLVETLRTVNSTPPS